MPIRTILFCLLLATTLGVQAKVYRWTDENGQTVYSQSPPPDGKAEEIKPPPPPSRPASIPGQGDADSSPPAGETEKGGEAKGPATADTQPEVVEDPEIKARNCQAARHNLRVYEGLGSRLVKREDGSIYRPNEEERQQKIDESRAQVEKYCDE